jgi:hypothetical protein
VKASAKGSIVEVVLPRKEKEDVRGDTIDSMSPECVFLSRSSMEQRTKFGVDVLVGIIISSLERPKGSLVSGTGRRNQRHASLGLL